MACYRSGMPRKLRAIPAIIVLRHNDPHAWRALILEALHHSGGDVVASARAMGIHASTLWAWIAEDKPLRRMVPRRKSGPKPRGADSSCEASD
jgi:hypothetical protein